jgi:hypothetical protein
MSLSVPNDNHEENLEVDIIVFALVIKIEWYTSFAL